jgi:hypothetical protein
LSQHHKRNTASGHLQNEKLGMGNFNGSYVTRVLCEGIGPWIAGQLGSTTGGNPSGGSMSTD